MPTAASDNPPVVVVSGDAGVAKPHGKKRHKPAPRPASGGSEPFDGDAEEIDPGPTTVALGAADRALESRGDDTTLPAQTIDMAGGGKDARPLDDGEIGAVINGQGGGLKDCVVQGATNTDLRGTITIKLVVDGRGKVIKTRVQAPHYLLEHNLLGCTQRAAARMHFPATGAPTLVTFPINLG
ncbi:MAG TPA: hypothetical protein VFP84_20475 [Kofleriaceae bacterium]|nr:hypothetical protein [Kofleriaceae bacterium]